MDIKPGIIHEMGDYCPLNELNEDQLKQYNEQADQKDKNKNEEEWG